MVEMDIYERIGLSFIKTLSRKERGMGLFENWFFLAFLGMLSFAGMTLVLKQLTFNMPTPLILLYLFASATLLYLVYNLKTGVSLMVSSSSLLLIILAAILTFVANLCDVSAVKLAPNVGYASAVKSGQILVVTVAAYYLFRDQEISWNGVLGTVLIFLGIVFLGRAR